MEERINNIQKQLDDNPELRDVAKEDIDELSKLNIKVPKEDEEDSEVHSREESCMGVPVAGSAEVWLPGHG